MRRQFANRQELVAYLREEFPEAAEVDDHIPMVKGGRQAAEQKLSAVDPVAYETNRNYLNGAASHLSPYIRHGLLSLADVREAVSAALVGKKAGKLLQQLAWRDYFQRLYALIGSAIWQNLEPYKTGFSADDYADDLPKDIRDGKTGLACIDAYSRELAEKGYLHNHARLWLAGYVVHWRRIKWQAGAHWFLQHLLDGDPASNNLSWQWVASTFSHKPYFYNRENVEKFTEGRYCRDCPLFGYCDFEGSYPSLERRLFPHRPPMPQPQQKRGRSKKEKRWHQ